MRINIVIIKNDVLTAIVTLDLVSNVHDMTSFRFLFLIPRSFLYEISTPTARA